MKHTINSCHSTNAVLPGSSTAPAALTPTAPHQNAKEEWVSFKVDAELETPGYHHLVDQIYEDTDLNNSFPVEHKCCEDIFFTHSLEKDVSITFPLTIWFRIEKHVAERTSDLEVRALMEAAIVDVPKYSWMGCPQTLRILTVTRQDFVDSEYQEFLEDGVDGPQYQQALNIARTFLKRSTE